LSLEKLFLTRFNIRRELVRIANYLAMHTPNPKPAADLALRRADFVFRKPGPMDGARVFELVAACPPLDRNSMYCNLLQCTHFADTCIVAEHDGRLVGWISGYRPPAEPSTLFIWQVAVHERARGTGLARKMLLALVDRPASRDIRCIRTTVTAGNAASRALFRSIARRKDAPMREGAGFERDTHFRGRHDAERLIVIGPIPPARQKARQV
jgi:L-2,4-diaminobutyric acid acetyltransferase